jgi:type IV pilus assembly protein PilV
LRRGNIGNRQECAKYIKKDRDKGFTLIEVLIAIVILSVGLLGMASLTIGIIKGNLFSNQLTTATTLAQDQMENVRALGYNGTPSSDTTETEGYNTIANYPYYKRVTVTDCDILNNPDAEMKMVTITTYWDSDPPRLN